MTNARTLVAAIIFRIELVIPLDVFIRDIHPPSYLAIDDLTFFHFGLDRNFVARQGLPFAAERGLEVIVREAVIFFDLLDIAINLVFSDAASRTS